VLAYYVYLVLGTRRCLFLIKYDAKLERFTNQKNSIAAKVISSLVLTVLITVWLSKQS